MGFVLHYAHSGEHDKWNAPRMSAIQPNESIRGPSVHHTLRILDISRTLLDESMMKVEQPFNTENASILTCDTVLQEGYSMRAQAKPLFGQSYGNIYNPVL